jgi:hypothetical protein
MSVYSGKIGCCCGCNGKHSYNSKHIDAASAYRGYKVEPNEVNDKQITRVLNLLRANVSKVEFYDGSSGFCSHFSFQTETRSYVVYMTL